MPDDGEDTEGVVYFVLFLRGFIVSLGVTGMNLFSFYLVAVLLYNISRTSRFKPFPMTDLRSDDFKSHRPD